VRSRLHSDLNSVTIYFVNFTWDEEKAKSNAAKHGVTFEEAQTVMSARATKKTAREPRPAKVRVSDQEPSAASLKEIPPADPKHTLYFGRGPEGLRKLREHVSRKRGRPKKGATAEGTATKTVRFPIKVWEELERSAKKRGVSVHAAMREAIAKWLAT